MGRQDVCPTEDAFQALLDYLVDPLLPTKPCLSRATPSLSQQQSVAKQVSAVVILYNYYHRKQCPQLEFLGFDAVCKLAVILKPALLSYMKFMLSSDDIKFGDHENQVAITEKAIMDACDISSSLSALKDASSIKNWPISKVIVLLIDCKKENCLVLNGCITQGVWSVIEKDLDISNCPPETEEIKHTNKRKRVMKKIPKNELREDEASIQRFAHSAVKEATGIDGNDLMILESHLVYSLSRENSAARFYIMQCTQSTYKDVFLVSIRDVIDSLQGPLFSECGGTWFVTPVVEYFHVLPLSGIILDWLCREVPSIRLQYAGVTGLNVNSSSFKDVEEPARQGTYISKFRSTLDCTAMDDVGMVREELGKVVNASAMEDLGKEDSSAINGCFITCSSNAVNAPKHIDVANFFEVSTCVREEKINKFYQRRERTSCMENNSSSPADVAKTMDEIVITKPESIECRDEEVASKKISCDTQTVNNAPVTCQCNRKHVDQLKANIALREDLIAQAALRTLMRKKDKLALQQRMIQDDIACCEKKIQTIIRGGEDGTALQIESIIEGCSDVCISVAEETTYPSLEGHRSPQSLQRKISSEVTACKQNPCQELDGICHQNGWTLPAYHVYPTSGGAFESKVTVRGAAFESSSCSDPCCSPRKARESAAAKILSLFEEHGKSNKGIFQVHQRRERGV